MTHALDPHASVLVVGAGVMGAGIAQLAARYGHSVFLFDTQPDASARAIETIQTDLTRLVDRGKFSKTECAALVERLHPVETLAEAREVGIVMEAIVENLDAKCALLAQVEKIVSPECLITTNTSSISINAIARALSAPERLVGMHFFNPVPIMKLVEVISGAKTDAAIASAVYETAKAWGKTAVHARSTPGFIVNRIARPFYAEALNLLQDRFTSAEQIDACIRAAGFRMGPCELMDLIGQDVNFAVTQSVFAENFFDKRYTPSVIQKELVDGGLLGRKSGYGFYPYPAEKESTPSKTENDSLAAIRALGQLTLHGDDATAQFIANRLTQIGADFARDPASLITQICAHDFDLRLTDGRPASDIAAGQNISNVAVFDWIATEREPSVVAWARSVQSDALFEKKVEGLLGALGFTPIQVQDYPGLIVARTISMIVNEANDAVNQGVCSEDDADSAMRLGANYPAGPFDWQNQWGALNIKNVLSALNDFYRGERYRISPALQHAVWRDTSDH